ncbi:fungal-specific transcription factor domain-containing protein [Exophiala viscosa]|uniref:Fungal-specific transcription factor domain-containing protein n=1 Tax=Exophiala viscosa TaxID=2486360 RepID=A0AAN6E613_9EURO|nr:fungal-specific transcription factor domain-containing protein [Exophiala viscosa]
MSSQPEEDDTAHAQESESQTDDVPTTEAAQKQAAKRRTKTGCLTCRKRRIKCGEEKPTCKNCVKSKRDCLGYVQPFVYKQQAEEHAGLVHGVAQQVYPGHPGSVPPAGYANVPFQYGLPESAMYQGYHAPGPLPYQQDPFSASYHAYPSHAPDHHQVPHPPPGANPQYWQNPQHSGGFDGNPTYHPSLQHNSAPPQTGHWENASSMVTTVPQGGPSSSFQQDNYTNVQQHQNPVHFTQQQYPLPQQFAPPQTHLQGGLYTHGRDQYTSHQPPLHGPAAPSDRQLPHATRHDDYDDPDDPFDVDSEEENFSFHAAAENFTQILDQSSQQRNRVSRHYSGQRPHHNVTTFRSPPTGSPLRDERNQHIFHHFVEVTAKCISVFERHHFASMGGPARTLWNFTIPSLAMSNAALAHAILALGALHLSKLENTADGPAVKHFTYSIRRVGRSLGLPNRRHEIATLATVLVLGFYEVMSGDHSRWNLHLSGATKLVLEHDFAGSTRTARRMRNGAKARVNQWMARFALTEENYARVAGIPLALLDDIDWDVDSAFVSRLTGTHVDYDHQVQPQFPLPTLVADLTEKDIEDFKAKMDLRWWYCKQDIFQSLVGGDRLLMKYEDWIYCPPRGQFGKAANPYATIDYLSLIMGRLADFGGKDRFRKQRSVAAQGGVWKPPAWLSGPQGPPGMGKHGAGSNTGPPGTGPQIKTAKGAGNRGPPVSGAPSANEGRVRQSKPNSQSSTPPSGPPPGMFGMIPPPEAPIELHSAFKTMDASINDQAFTGKVESKSQSPQPSLEDETSRAMAEHANITRAFDLFAKSLGFEFEPVSYTDPAESSPFRPVPIYRNAGIACIWAFYNVGRILLHRLHPDMPPAAMVAAGITARFTQEYAQTIGKICAGLYATQQYSQSGALDPTFAGALMESSFSLLFAGVQYQSAEERAWTVANLQDIAQRCGWKTAASIAAACERAWERMGELGRGPPYERTIDVNSQDARVKGGGTSVTRRASSQAPDALEEIESKFVRHDRSLINHDTSTRVHWALGLLSVEEDIKQMSLDDN